jgi:signal transduction histidine kinase/PAS domain-containing protein
MTKPDIKKEFSNLQGKKIYFVWLFKLFFPHLVFAVFVITLLKTMEDISDLTLIILIGGMLLYFFIRVYFYYYRLGFFLWSNLKSLKQVINEFKKGKFLISDTDIEEESTSGLLKELLVVGQQFESIVSSQSDELKKFHEIYSQIILSINSIFIVIDKSEKILYVNEGFCKKFNVDQEGVAGKGLDSIFYFVNTRIKIGINHIVKDGTGDSVVLKNVHLMSINRKSIISDIKISGMMVNGEEQIVIIIDDITDRFSKNYQASILSHLSESISDGVESDRVLYNILFGVTSGSGLGFNRAMLFLVEDDRLKGKMALGPDSFEEAIEIWNNLSNTEFDYSFQYPLEVKRNRLFEKVMAFDAKLHDENIFCAAVRDMSRIHVKNAFEDSRVGDDIRSFMEVDEFLIMPLVSFKKAIGIIVADNKYNMTGISAQSIDLLSIFSIQAAFLIESYFNLIELKQEMKKLEEKQEAIVESEKMAAVGRIASHIAHEIRNPLVTMGGYAKRILRLLKQDLPDEEKIVNSAEIIQRESERLEKILSNVMDFTRPSKYIKEFNDINSIINDTYSLFKNYIYEKKISVSLILKKDLPLVKSDFNQMKQVLLNLFQNAIDATPEGGEIHVVTENDGEYVYVYVRDTGSGIKEEDPNVVFEPFFTTKITGIGLGLANVKKIIKDHKGKIKAYNREGPGAEFVIKLPLPVSESKDPVELEPGKQ